MRVNDKIKYFKNIEGFCSEEALGVHPDAFTTVLANVFSKLVSYSSYKVLRFNDGLQNRVYYVLAKMEGLELMFVQSFDSEGFVVNNDIVKVKMKSNGLDTGDLARRITVLDRISEA